MDFDGPQSPDEPDPIRTKYSDVASLLRRNERMLLAEQTHHARRLAEREMCGDGYGDLLLYELFGLESRRRREQAEILHRQQLRLARLRLLLNRASSALDVGNLAVAEKILQMTSPQLAILPDDVGVDAVTEMPLPGNDEADADPGELRTAV